jgi:hypothetical protein
MCCIVAGFPGSWAPPLTPPLPPFLLSLPPPIACRTQRKRMTSPLSRLKVSSASGWGDVRTAGNRVRRKAVVRRQVGERRGRLNRVRPLQQPLQFLLIHTVFLMLIRPNALWRPCELASQLSGVIWGAEMVVRFENELLLVHVLDG